MMPTVNQDLAGIWGGLFLYERLDLPLRYKHALMFSRGGCKSQSFAGLLY